MAKDKLARQDVKEEILKLASDEEEHPASYFVKEIEAAKNTVLKYLKVLVSEDHLMSVNLNAKFKPVFKINETGLENVTRSKLKGDVYVKLEKLSNAKLKDVAEALTEENVELRRMLEEKEKEALEERFNHHIFMDAISHTLKLISDGKHEELTNFSLENYMLKLKKEHEERDARLTEFVNIPGMQQLFREKTMEFLEQFKKYEESYKKN